MIHKLIPSIFRITRDIATRVTIPKSVPRKAPPNRAAGSPAYSLSGNEQGISLTEVLAGIVVSTILIALAAVAIITFFNKFTELSHFADVQQRAYETIETVKYGYPFEELDTYVFVGIANADSIQLQALPGGWGRYSGVRCIPDRSAQGHAHDFVRYYYSRYDQAILMEARHGVQYYQQQIFPQRGEENIEITQFDFTPLGGGGANNPRVVRLEIKAEAIISEEKRKEISYSTIIARGR
jgi:hypothetical protein